MLESESLPRPHYAIDGCNVDFIFKMTPSEKKRCFKIWFDRYLKLLDAEMAIGYQCYITDKISRLIVVLYERCCAIKYKRLEIIPQPIVNLSYHNPDLKPNQIRIISKNELPEAFVKKYRL